MRDPMATLMKADIARLFLNRGTLSDRASATGTRDDAHNAIVSWLPDAATCSDVGLHKGSQERDKTKTGYTKDCSIAFSGHLDFRQESDKNEHFYSVPLDCEVSG